MHITIRRYHIHPGSTQELLERVRTGFLPVISQAQNFISYDAVDEGDLLVDEYLEDLREGSGRDRP